MSIEREVRKRNKKSNLQRLILGTVETAGLIAVGLIAPNVLGAMGKMKLLPHQRQKETIQSARKRLVKKGYLEYEDGMLRITEEGKRFLIKETLFENYKKRKKKWDRKWRVLIFDIPEKRKIDREHIRHTLISIGFMRLQRSVWVYPYDCEELITLIKADIKIGKDVLYMIVDAIEYDKPIKKYFGLY
jgi:CRISPR-associated endonuclease Cas2